MKFVQFFIPILWAQFAIGNESILQEQKILIQVSDKSTFSDLKFSKFKKVYGLEQIEFFSTSRVGLFSIKDKVDSLQLCKELERLKGVKSCLIDSKLEFNTKDSLSCNDESSEVLNLSSFKKILSNISPCEVFPRGPIPPFHVEDGRKRPEGLSPYWAQEYIGADLTREALKSLKLNDNKLENLVQVWDSDNDNHGTKVSNLISGPYETAVVPREKKLEYKNLHHNSDYFRSYENFYADCVINKNCPAYINNSMVWDNSLIGDLAGRISKSGTVIITAAGNDHSALEKSKRDVSLAQEIIVVSSLAPDGYGSKFSDFGLGVTIAAPADLTAFSYDAEEKPIAFGGTSAATPLVTGSLEAFTTVTNYRLSGQEATRLLQMTAIQFPFYPTPNGLGAGMLNSYKIYEVANRLKELCKSKDQNKCIKEKLQDHSIFSFSQAGDSLLDSFDSAFPFCYSGKSKKDIQEKSCLDKKKIISELRKSAFLNPNSKELWSRLACLYRSEGFEANAKFYDSLAKRPVDDSELAKQIFLEKKVDFYRYLFPVLDLSKNKEWLDELINKGVAREEIIEKILTDARFYNNDGKAMVLKILDSSCCDQLIAKKLLTQKNWQGDSQVIAKILEKGLADKELVEHVFSSLDWKDMKAVEKICERGSADKEIINSALVIPGRDDRKLLEILISKGTYNQEILAAKRNSQLSFDLLEGIVKQGGADRQAVAFHLRNESTTQTYNLLKVILLRGEADAEIQEHILRDNSWRNFLSKELQINENDLSLENLKLVIQ